MVAAAQAAEILDALRGYFWIGLAAVVVWRLFPVIRKRFESGDLSFKLFGQEMTVSEASERLHSELDDLRNKVIELGDRVDRSADEATGDAATEAAPEALAEPDRPPVRPTRILWVDDEPKNNAFLIESLRTDRGAEVIEATSTDEALEDLGANPRGFDVVISDMGREERGGIRPLAGVDLLRRMRDQGLTVPVVIYASPDAVARGREAAVDAGAVAVTASATELLTLLRIGPTTEFEASVADVLRTHLDATVFPIRGSVDFVALREGERIAIEIKNWSRTPTREGFERALERVRAARERYRFDRIFMVTRAGIDVPAGVDLPDWISVQTIDELGASLTAGSA